MTLDCEKVFKWVSRLKKTYQLVEGFEDKISPKRVESHQRIINTILKHCGDVEGKLFLDIGSNLGYFSIELAKRGAYCRGIELNQNRVNVSMCLSKEINAHFVCGNSVDYVLENDIDFDYVLLLNVFHHILVQDEEGGWKMFNKLVESTDGVFVMMRNSLKHWSLCKKRSEIPQAVIEKSKATSYVEYPPVNGRVIYVFTQIAIKKVGL